MLDLADVGHLAAASHRRIVAEHLLDDRQRSVEGLPRRHLLDDPDHDLGAVRHAARVTSEAGA